MTAAEELERLRPKMTQMSLHVYLRVPVIVDEEIIKVMLSCLATSLTPMVLIFW